jgi:hypothetical protein
MISACAIVDSLLEAEDDSPAMLAHYLNQAGDWVLLVPSTIPQDPTKWFVLTRPVTVAQQRLDGGRWRVASTHPTQEAAVEAAHAFLKAHGKTP